MQFFLNGTEYNIEYYSGIGIKGYAWTTKQDECAGYFDTQADAQQDAIAHAHRKANDEIQKVDNELGVDFKQLPESSNPYRGDDRD